MKVHQFASLALLTSNMGTSLGNDMVSMANPCTMLKRITMLEDYHTEASIECELEDGGSLVPIEGLPADIEFESGISTFFSTDAAITKTSLILPSGSSNYIIDSTGTRRRKLSTTGDKSVLAVKIRCPDAETDFSLGSLRDSVFGSSSDVVNLKSQYSACSFGKLNVLEASPGTYDGVLEVAISTNASGEDNGTIRNAVTAELSDNYGITLSTYDHIMYCIPPGTSGGWIGYGYIGWHLTVYNNNWCTYPSIQMHEVGHNLRLAHTGVGSNEYSDQSGMMGYSYGQDEGPLMCFTGPKNWRLGWYNDRTQTINPLVTNFSGTLVGLSDYNISTPSQYVVLLIQGDSISSDYDYYVSFNRKSGVNSGTLAAGDQVLVHERPKGTGYANAYRRANMNAGGTYTIPSTDIFIEVLSIDLASSPATTSIRIVGITDTSSVPTESPSSGSSASPSSGPSASPSSGPSASPSSGSSASPTESPSSGSSASPSESPSSGPSASPSSGSSASPTESPSSGPSASPSESPSSGSSASPSESPSSGPSASPSSGSSASPSESPSSESSASPSSGSSASPSESPSSGSSASPSESPSSGPSASPSSGLSASPSESPSSGPSASPSSGSSASPTESPTSGSSASPSSGPSASPSSGPSPSLSSGPSASPSSGSSASPSESPSSGPSASPSKASSSSPSEGSVLSSVPSSTPSKGSCSKPSHCTNKNSCTRKAICIRRSKTCKYLKKKNCCIDESDCVPKKKFAKCQIVKGCVNNKCQFGNICADGNPCTKDICNRNTGACKYRKIRKCKKRL